MDYEALGHYLEAVEKLRRLLPERNRLLLNLSSELQIAAAVSVSVDRLKTVNFDEACQRIREVTNDLTTAVAEANAYATRCQRPLFILEKNA